MANIQHIRLYLVCDRRSFYAGNSGSHCCGSIGYEQRIDWRMGQCAVVDLRSCCWPQFLEQRNARMDQLHVAQQISRIVHLVTHPQLAHDAFPPSDELIVSGQTPQAQVDRPRLRLRGQSHRLAIALRPRQWVGLPSDTDRSAAPRSEQVAAPHPDPLPVASAGLRGEGTRPVAPSESGPLLTTLACVASPHGLCVPHNLCRT